MLSLALMLPMDVTQSPRGTFWGPQPKCGIENFAKMAKNGPKSELLKKNLRTKVPKIGFFLWPHYPIIQPSTF